MKKEVKKEDVENLVNVFIKEYYYNLSIGEFELSEEYWKEIEYYMDKYLNDDLDFIKDK